MSPGIAHTQGEIADRISILELKRAHGLLAPELMIFQAAYRGRAQDLERLREINACAWPVVERIHGYFAGPVLPADARIPSVIEDCRAAHQLNRLRVAVKNAINAQFNEAREEKTWKPTTT